ncbi:MAG: acetyl-coenzyme A synthetase N-terminal domain-containing protein, partial [Oceanicaulis sp.]
MNAARYAALYRSSIETPDAFWREQIGRLDWFRRPEKLSEVSWDPD